METRLIFSKLVRIYNKDHTIPKRCFAMNHFPECLTQICDCKVFCKFPPNGNIDCNLTLYHAKHGIKCLF